MQIYEYKVVPAPTKGKKGPGVKGPDGRFAHSLELEMNALAAEGWEYLRADILPSEERQGLTSTQTVYRSVLVFRRAVEPEAATPPGPLPWEEPEATTAEEVIEDAQAIAEEVDDPYSTHEDPSEPDHPSEPKDDPHTRP